jgi:hypothetical protein
MVLVWRLGWFPSGREAPGNDVAECDHGFAEAQFLVWCNGKMPVADRAAQRPERAVASDERAVAG